MKINKNYKLEKAVSVKDSRPAIENVFVTNDGKKPVAVATNSRILAVVPCEVESEAELGLVSPAALIRARKLAGRLDESVMLLNGNITFQDESALPRPNVADAGKFPDWKVVYPDKDAKIAFTVSLDPRLLLNLAEAIGCDGSQNKAVTLRFVDEMTAIHVSRGVDGAHGLLMPVRVAS